MAMTKRANAFQREFWKRYRIKVNAKQVHEIFDKMGIQSDVNGMYDPSVVGYFFDTHAKDMRETAEEVTKPQFSEEDFEDNIAPWNRNEKDDDDDFFAQYINESIQHYLLKEVFKHKSNKIK